MGSYSKAEIDDAFASCKDLAKQSYETWDWTIFPQVFTEDVRLQVDRGGR